MKTKRDLHWATMLRELEAFQEAYGHLRVEEQRKRYPALCGWWGRIRGRLERLTYDEILDLDNLRFFDRLDQRWLDRYAQLKVFKEAKGHCRVPKPWPGNPPLAGWVQFQRRRVEKMVQWRRKLLTDLGFDWAPIENYWRARYEELLEFRRRFGHANVPARWAENHKLATWVYEQRFRKAALSRQQIAMLEKAGLEWDPYETGWTRYYEELKEFRRENGPCDPPVSKSALGGWVHHQRTKANKMPLHRKKLLNEIGFSWNGGFHDAWMRHYEELKAFRIKHGRSPVPVESPLGKWVSNQRTAYRKLKMPPERKKLLNEIGFLWAIRTPRRRAGDKCRSEHVLRVPTLQECSDR